MNQHEALKTLTTLGEYVSRWAEFHQHDRDMCEKYNEDQDACEDTRIADKAYNTLGQFLETKPFIYINVSGGIAGYETFSESPIDILFIDWDDLKDVSMTEEDIREKIKQARATPKDWEWRANVIERLQEALDEKVEYEEWLRETEQREHENNINKHVEALIKAGYTVEKP